MAVKEIIVKSEKINKRDRIINITKLIIFIVLFLLLFFFLVLKLIYNGGTFSIDLDKELYLDKSIIMYSDLDLKEGKTKLYAEDIPYIDNISVDWLPKDLNENSGGSHNGDNYLAYTFYLENVSDNEITYYYDIQIHDVIKSIDEAIRIMVYQNGTPLIYAKKNSYTNKNEEGTTSFYSDKYAIFEERKEFKPNDIDKYTVVIWLEGDDPDCVDALVGGEIKLIMNIRGENIQDEKNK